jgi:heme exporter protein A
VAYSPTPGESTSGGQCVPLPLQTPTCTGRRVFLPQRFPSLAPLQKKIFCYGPRMNVFRFDKTEFSGANLSCRRGGRNVLSDLSFHISSGEALILRGPNGSGKTTLLRLMAGLSQPTLGSMLWNGAAISEDLTAHGARLGFVGHLDAVKSAQTVRENLTFWAQLRGADEAQAATALKAFGLSHLATIPGRVLSAGQRHRLALARLMVSNAPLWLLDEPTNTLDDAALEALRQVLRQHLDCGGLVVVASHGESIIAQARTLDVRATSRVAA